MSAHASPYTLPLTPYPLPLNPTTCPLASPLLLAPTSHCTLHPWPQAGDYSPRSLGGASLYALDLRSPVYTLGLTPAGKLVETRQQCGGRSPRDVLLDAALREAPPSVRGDTAMRRPSVSRQRGAGLGLSKPCLGAVPLSAAAGAAIQDRVPWQPTAMAPLATAVGATLPAGWEQHADEQGTPYYHNAAEGVTTWRRPGGGTGRARRGGDVGRPSRHAHASRHHQHRGRHSTPRRAHGTADVAEGGGDDSGGDSVDGGGGGGRWRNDSAAHGGEGGAAPEQIELTPAMACSSITKAGFGFSGQAQAMEKIASTLEHSEARELQRSAMLAHPACRGEVGAKRCGTAVKPTRSRAAARGTVGSGGFAQVQAKRLEVEEIIRGMRAEGSIEHWQEARLRTELERDMLADDDDTDLEGLLHV